MVISSSDEEQVTVLTQQVQQSILPNQSQSPKWFHTTVLRYYIVLHESLNPDLSVYVSNTFCNILININNKYFILEPIKLLKHYSQHMVIVVVIFLE